MLAALAHGMGGSKLVAKMPNATHTGNHNATDPTHLAAGSVPKVVMPKGSLGRVNGLCLLILIIYLAQVLSWLKL